MVCNPTLDRFGVNSFRATYAAIPNRIK